MNQAFVNQFILSFQEKIESLKNEDRAAWSKAYMKNQFNFLGLQAAERRSITKTFLQENTITDLQTVETIVITLWQLDYREYQYAAVEILAFYKKQWTKETITLIEHCLTTKSWWDSVDHVIIECVGSYFKLFNHQTISITSKWNKSSNIWLQRASILFQKSYKKNTDTAILESYIVYLSGSKEFFVQKAIGWALREYARTNETWVKAFVNKHTLNSLSKREALKRIAS